MAKKEIGKGFDGMFSASTTKIEKGNKTEEKPKEKLLCDIDADLKKRMQLYKIEHRISLGKIVEMAIEDFLKKHEDK